MAVMESRGRLGLQKLRHVAARLLHKGPASDRSFYLCFVFYLQNSTFSEWAMLGSNQRPLPCEGSALPLS